MRVLTKVRKDLKVKNGRRMTRNNATTVLAQGAMAPPKKNFGDSRGSTSRKSKGSMMACFDARLPRTLGLPRAVGPYTIIRTTALHQSSQDFIMFTPFFDITGKQWFNWCGIEDVVATDDITKNGNTRPIAMPMQALESACEVVPSALTVQVMNPASLQSADGVFAMARVNQQLMLGNSPAGETYRDMVSKFVAFYSPRLLTGGKLSLRGVKCSAYPLDMSEYATFAGVSSGHPVGAPFTWSNAQHPAALSPIVFIQNNAVPKTLEFMVTIEWRVRFDPGNPATASHTYHETLPDEVWNGLIKGASECGHGVEEIAEEVASSFV